MISRERNILLNEISTISIMHPTIETRYLNLVEELGLGRREEVSTIIPLTGGVASDIVQVIVGDQRLCLKCALEKLKVDEDWRAPVHRNRAEYAWLEVAAQVIPESTVALFGRSQQSPCFAMEFLEGDDTYLWKTSLLNGTLNVDEAISVGQAIGKIHARSASSAFSTEPFRNRDDFYELRLDPYLKFTASRHPAVAAHLESLVERLYEASSVLTHGDVSPKNIIFRDGSPIILDAECATMGDASFDIAFCMNHLVLKAVHLPAVRSELLNAALEVWGTYVHYVHWESPEQLEAKVCELLPALMLSRIDGKSPVEYLTEENRQVVRELSLKRLQTPCISLERLMTSIAYQLENDR
ncbi:MAG: phosphotransferase [Gammaproteobacteria bacterium]|nr:phosphotransferase [Gammaproteobacteria bacterium]